MLSQEALDRLHARLSGGEAAPEAPTPEPEESPAGTGSKVEGDKPEGTEDGTPEPTDQKVDPEHHREDEQKPKLVPLEEVVKLRGERRKLREELEQTRRENAELKGFVKGSRQTKEAEDDDPQWLKELTGTAKPAPEAKTPEPDGELAEVKEFMAEYKRTQGQALLDQVVKDCKAQDPTVPADFLIDNFTAGRSPEAAMQKWAAYKSKLTPPAAATPPPQAPKAKAPPFVPPAPSSGGQAKKANDWGSVSKAVREAMAQGK